MKGKVAVLALAIVIVIAFAGRAYAQWNAISSGYAVTTDFHGLSVSPGTLVTVTAGTTDVRVFEVIFVWHYPDGSVAFTETVPVTWTTCPTPPPSPIPKEITDWVATQPTGFVYGYAQSSHVADVLGDWGVQALFHDHAGHQVGEYTEIVAVRSTSFNVVPLIPVLGTAGMALSLLAGLGLFIKRRRK